MNVLFEIAHRRIGDELQALYDSLDNPKSKWKQLRTYASVSSVVDLLHSHSY